MRTRRWRAFTLLELLIVLTIIGIVVTLLIPVYATSANGRKRCNAWPTSAVSISQAIFTFSTTVVGRRFFIKNYGTGEDFANAWVAALAPFSVERKSWICPDHPSPPA